ncbi:MAG: enoyl-CoA hydratase/isomerase family protein [Deltaproteobacteria bacterium]|nr:enoyl-CoA hydratase/isomerase family protein [Deltaproteobacteria bacterium]
MSELVRLEKQDRVGVVTIDRPKALNALDRGVIEELGGVLDRVEGDPSLGALVLTGAGRAFVAGADVAAMRTMTPLDAEVFSLLAHRVFARLEGLPIPTIAAVNGFALGGGCELALACDFIFAAREAKIGQPETKLGLIPGFGGTSRLVRRVGIAWAKQLVLVGDPIDAEEALRIGLVNRVFEAAELMPQTLATARAAAARAPVATRLAKQIMQEGQDADVRTAHALEQRAFGLVFSTEDRVEGTTAFVEKRDAKFQGR